MSDLLYEIDGYKLDHRRQSPPGTTKVYSNFTARGSRVAGQKTVVVFGIQHFLDKFFVDWAYDLFVGAWKEDVALEYADEINQYLGPNQIGTAHIEALHDLGYLPLKVCALPEGTHAPLRVPVLTIENTHPDFFWLTNYFETLLSQELWGPMTSATTASRFYKLFREYALMTGSPLEFVQWQGHDFSSRGMFGRDAAVLSGMAHLVFFTGTDTVPAIREIRRYYNPWDNQLPDNYLIGGSVAATEHSVTCAGGQENERDTYERIIRLYPDGIVSLVFDTWDFFGAVTNILPLLRDLILGRNGKVVIRPDSGDPVKIICGDMLAPRGTPERKGVVELLWEIFGGTTTAKGYKLLDPHIGVIYGDGINEDRAQRILEGLADKGFASANMVFGLGSFTYQYVTRDTYNFAMKATSVEIDGVERAIFKRPKTDDGTKFSAVGRLAVLKKTCGELYVVENATPAQEAESELRCVWADGEFFDRGKRDNIADIRQRAVEGLPDAA